MPESKQVLIVSAEASSNLYAQRLMEEARSQELPIHFWGVGNKDMIRLGFESLAAAEDMAVMGFQEVLKHYPFIKSVYKNILSQVVERQTKLAILMDYAEFNMKLAGDLNRLGIPVVFYIAPQIWAWRQGRVHKLRASVDKLLCIFPFEQKFYSDFGVPTEFVGHPLLDELREEYFSASHCQLYRMQLGFRDNQKVLGLMPGSRVSEIQRNFPIQLATAELLQKQDPDLAVLVLVAPGLDINRLREQVAGRDLNFLFLQESPFRMLQLVDFVLVASGTATLVTGLMHKPMVVMYRMKALSAFLAKLLVSKSQRFFAMVNLIFGRPVVPEFFQEQATPERLAESIREQWYDPQVYQRSVNELQNLASLLGDKGVSRRVWESVREFL